MVKKYGLHRFVNILEKIKQLCVEKWNIAELSLKTIRAIIDTIALTTKVVSG